MQVHEVPSYEEFYGLTDNELTDDDFESDNEDEKKKKMIIIMLGLLQEFYLLHMYDTEYYIASEEFKEEITKLNSRLKENLLILFNEYIRDIQSDLSIKYNLPLGETVASNVEIGNVLDSGVDAITNTLYADLKNKADFYTDVAVATGVFTVHANFRRAVKRLVNVIDYNAQYVDNLINREYMAFVYGQEALFQWRVSGRNTCPWCYEMEAMGAMPLSYFPVDHPNGHCWLEPVNGDEYSQEYLDLIGWW